MDPLVEFNQDLVAELRDECEASGLPIEDVAFERLSGTLEAEGVDAVASAFRPKPRLVHDADDQGGRKTA